MTFRSRLFDELVADEGLKLRLYQDEAGNWTIGIGHNLTGKGISKRIAMALFDEDMDEVVADLDASFPWFGKLDAVRQRAIVNLRFNLGRGGFRTFKKFLACMAAKDYGKAAAELRDSKWYDDVQPSRSARILHHVATGDEV